MRAEPVWVPRVPAVRLGVVLIGGDEADLSLHEVCERSLRLPLDVELHRGKASVLLTDMMTERIFYQEETDGLAPDRPPEAS